MRGNARTVWEVLSTALVVGAALTMLGVHLHDRARVASPEDTALASVDNWRDWGESGVRMGGNDAPMVIAAFMDFSCPYCRDLVPVLDSMRAEFPGGVAIEFHHFPLTGHRFSPAAAMAAECAFEQGRFPEMYHLLFSEMDSIGSKSWDAFAAGARVSDISRFQECIQLPQEAFDRVTASVALGRRIGVKGTPKVWVNGQLFQGRTLEAFRRLARGLGI